MGYGHQRYINREILAPLDLTHTYGLLSQVDIGDVVSGYHHPYEADLREIDFISPSGSMVATAQDVGVFLRALNDGSLLNDDEQTIYSSIYEYEHTGWVLGYKSIARYHKDIDTVVIQFVNTTGEDTELTSIVVYNRIVRILRRQCPGVVLEQTAEMFVATNGSVPHRTSKLDTLVADSLVRTLQMIMIDVCRDRATNLVSIRGMDG